MVIRRKKNTRKNRTRKGFSKKRAKAIKINASTPYETFIACQLPGTMSRRDHTKKARELNAGCISISIFVPNEHWRRKNPSTAGWLPGRQSWKVGIATRIMKSNMPNNILMLKQRQCTKVIANEEALAEAKRNYGYFALLSNEVRDPLNALEIYRNKDLVEKGFNNLKERLNLRRMAVSSEHSLDGKLFVQFVALIYLSYITRKMQQNKLFKNYTMQKVLDEFDVIECFEVPGQQIQVGEITKRQVELYAKLGIEPPASLQ